MERKAVVLLVGGALTAAHCFVAGYGRTIASLLTPVMIAVLPNLLLSPWVDLLHRKVKSRMLATLMVTIPAYGHWRGIWWSIHRLPGGRRPVTFPPWLPLIKNLFNGKRLCRWSRDGTQNLFAYPGRGYPTGHSDFAGSGQDCHQFGVVPVGHFARRLCGSGHSHPDFYLL